MYKRWLLRTGLKRCSPLRQGLYGLGDKAALALWLQEFAASLDQRRLALEAYGSVAGSARVWRPIALGGIGRRCLASGAQPDAQHAAPHLWLDRGRPGGHIAHEDLVEDAIAKIGDRPDAETLARRRKAISVRPGWAIRQSLSQAIRIIEPGQSRSYPQAVEWLRRAAMRTAPPSRQTGRSSS